jgi:hypothetical protein
MSMPHSHHDALYDVKRDEHHREEEAFMKDRVDERFVTKPRSQTKMFGSEQNLCEDERVNERKRVLLVIQMMLREDEALVEREQSKHNPEVNENRDESLEFFGGSLFQVDLTRNW